MDKAYYSQVFYHSTSPSAILEINAPEFTILDATPEYASATNVDRDYMIGKPLFEVFPDSGEENNNGPASLRISLHKVLETKETDKMPIVKYDIVNHKTGLKEEKYWEPTNTPIFNERQEIVKILHTAIDVTDEVMGILTKRNHPTGLEQVDLKFKNIFDLSSVGIAMVDLKGNWIEVNPKICEILGYSRWEILRKNFMEMTHPDDLDIDLEAMEKLINNQIEAHKSEKRFYNKGGETVWVYLSVTLVRKTDGEPLHFVAHTIDITDKKKIELALEESELRYQSLFRHNPDPVFSFDLEGKFVTANEATCKMAETDLKDLLGTYFLPFVPFEDKRRVYENFLIASEGASITYTCRFVSPKQTERVLNITNMPIITNGEIVGVYGLAKDITEKHKAEEALTKAKDQFEQLVSTIDGIVWESNENMKTLFISPQTTEILGYTPEEWYGRDNFWSDHIHVEDRQLFWTEFLAGMEKGENFNFEFRMINATGKTVWLRNMVTVIKRPGRPIILRGILADVSATKKAEQALERNRAKLSKILKRSLDVICTINDEGHFVDVSEASSKIWGYKPEELIGKAYIDFVLPEDHAATKKVASEVLSGKDLTFFENRYVHKEGHIVPISWSVHYDPKEKLMFSVARDVSRQKEVENQLVLSERRYKNLVQNGADIVGIVDSEANFVYISSNVEKVVGFTPEELKAKERLSLVHPEDVHIVESSLAEIQRVKTVVVPPHRFLRKDGSFIWVDTVATNHFDDPAINGIVINSRDITEKMKASEALRISEERHKLLFNSNPAPQWVFDAETLQFLDVNQTAINTYGYTKEEFLSMTIKDIGPETDIEKLKNSVSNFSSENGIHNFGVHTHRKNDGSLIQVEVTGYHFDFLNRKGVMIVAMDVTEREEALAALNDYKKKLQTAQKIANMGYWQIDLKDNSLYWTEELHHIWEVEKEEVTNVEWFLTTIHPEDVHVVQEAFAQGKETGEELDIEYRIQLPGERCKWIHEIGQLVCDEQGNRLYMEGTVQDISERKAAEKALEESNQRYELVTQATSDAIWDWDLQAGRVIYGESFYTTFGFDSLSLKQDRSDWEEKIHPNDLTRVNASMEEFIHSGETNWEEEYRYRKSNGDYAYVLDKAIAIRNPEQKALRIVGALQDISLENHLESENQLRISLGAVFSKDNSPLEAIQESLHELLDYTELAYGEFWLTSLNDSNSLSLAAYEGSYKAEPTRYLLETEKGSGLPGIAWQNNTTYTIKELHHNEEFNRNEFAQANGFESAIAYPITFKEEVLGVILLFSKEKDFDIEKRHRINPIILDQLASDFARKETEKELNSFFNLSEDLLIITEFSGVSKKVNRAVYNILGYTEEEYLKLQFNDLVYPDDRDKTQCMFEQVASGKPLPYFENRLISKSGKAVWMSWTASPVMEEKMLFAIGRDISQRKMYEKGLEDSRQKVVNTLESIQDAFFTLDRDFKFTYFNNKAEEILSRSREEVIGVSIWEAFPDAVNYAFYPVYNKVMNERVKQSFDEVLPSLGIWFDVTAYPAENGISVYFRDITERRNKEIELKQFKKVIENSKEGISIINLQQNKTYKNPALMENLGLEDEAPETKNGLTEHYADPEEAKSLYANVQNGEFFNGEVKLKRKDGEEVPYHLSAGPVYDENNNLIAIFGIHTDLASLAKSMRKKE